MDNIEEKQYENLRHSFNLLVKIILGSDYYNNACDVYQCDIEACKDIENKVDRLKYDLKMYKKLFYIMTIFTFLLIIKLVIN